VTSCACNWGPGADWDLALAVDVRVWQWPLASGARGWGPAVHTEMWSLQRGRRPRLPEEKEEGGGGSKSDQI
jgi:hypothetical protein